MSDGPGLFWALAMFDLNNSLKAMNGKVANHAYQRLVAPSAAKALACIYRIWILKTVWLGFRHDCNQDQSLKPQIDLWYKGLTVLHNKFCWTFFLYLNLKQKTILQTILVICFFHLECWKMKFRSNLIPYKKKCVTEKRT